MSDNNPPPFDCNTCEKLKYAEEMVCCCLCTRMVGTCHGSTRGMKDMTSVTVEGYKIRQGLCIECRRVVKEVAEEDPWTVSDKKSPDKLYKVRFAAQPHKPSDSS